MVKELTAAESEVVHLISREPLTIEELAESIGVSKSAVHGRISQIRDKLGQQSVHFDVVSQTYNWHGTSEQRRVSIKHKGTKTREANEWATRQEAAILRRLKAQEPLRARQNAIAGNEDLVAGFGDLHIGDRVETEDEFEVYNSRIAVASARHFTQKVLDIAKIMRRVNWIDTAHLVWTGDMVTNENIYEGQSYNIELMVADQVSMAVNVMVEQAMSLAEEFDTLQIVAVPGNHGFVRASGVSKQANMDMLAYRWVRDRLYHSEYDNVSMYIAEAKHYRNFELREGLMHGHARHGHNCPKHVDATRMSQAKWRGWQIKHGFDFAIHGHHHVCKKSDIMNQWPVIMTPSPKPGAEFAEKIGLPDAGMHRKLGVVFGVSDKRPMTWSFDIDDADMEMTIDT